MRSGSRLERVLRSGRFAVTAELNPPDSADPQAVYDRALVLASVCDAINATDASGANVHMSSVGVCALLTRAGYEPVMQVSCRDKNRIAIQGDLLGAAAMGVRNVLCLTGDGVQAGDQPEAKPVFDLDSLTLLRTACTLRDKGMFLSGRKLDVPPKLFLGAAENPFVHMLGHLTGRLLLEREPYKVNQQAVIDACAATGTWIELNANPYRFDLDWRLWPYAKSKGVKCVINCDAHRLEHAGFLRLGAGIARKGWLEKGDVINTLPLKSLVKELQRKRAK